MGQLTLSRFFILHVAILPGILMGLIGIHLVAFRHFGVSGPWNEKRRKRIGRFWPDQVFEDTVIVMLLVLILIGLAAYRPAPIEGPADPLDTSYVPKPEWNFLFLYQALKYFHGNLESIGTAGVPLFIILLLVFLPFLDRSPERNPVRRPFIMAGGLIFVILILTLAFLGYLSKGATFAQTPPAPVASPAHMSASAREGSQLFQSLGCIGCHRVNGTGGTVGPDLSNELLKDRSREWLITQIRDPKAHFLNTIMPPFNSLPNQGMNALVDYLQSLSYSKSPSSAAFAPSSLEEKKRTLRKPVPAPPATPRKVRSPLGPPGRAASIVGSPNHGAVLFKQTCESCHGLQGSDNVTNPGSEEGVVPALNPIDQSLFNKNPQVFAENIDRFIQHGSISEGPNSALRMMAFGETNTLTQQQISDIEAYVLHLNGIDRAQLSHPGIQPIHFFWLAVIVFGMTGLGLFGLWIGMSQRSKRKIS